LKSANFAPIIPPMSAPIPVNGPISITVNGDTRRVPSDASIEGLLTLLGLEPRKIAVERNLEIVPKSLYGQTLLAEGDRIEIVQFVGGG